MEINRSIEKNEGYFASLVLKLEDMASYPLLFVGIYLVIKCTSITQVLSPQ